VPLPGTKVFTTSDSGNPPRALLQQINELRPQPYQKTVKNRRVEVRIAKVGLAPAVLDRKLDQFRLPFDIELALQVQPVSLHRPHRQPAALRDLLAGKPFGQ